MKSNIMSDETVIKDYISIDRDVKVLQPDWANPPTVKDDNLHKFMVTEFVDAVRTLFVENGYNITSDDWRSGCFLVGVKGRLFSIESDFQVYEQDFYAVGSGAYHALGSLYTSKRNSPIKDIEKALETAEHFVTSVGRPFIIEQV